MPLMDGLSAAQIIHEQGLAGSIVFLTAYSDSSYIEGAKDKRRQRLSGKTGGRKSTGALYRTGHGQKQ